MGRRNRRRKAKPVAAPVEEIQDDQWRYSTCKGNRKALLVGIRYLNTGSPLSGCHNDVANVKDFLLKKGYKEENTLVLIDDEDTDPDLMPTRENIIAGMEWLVDGAAEDDALVFHFSGHGDSVEDEDGDEADGFDETILPCDFATAGMIIDDEIHAICVAPLPVGCRLTFLFDCCRSGSGADLPYTYRQDGSLVSHTSKVQHMENIKYHSMRGDDDALERAMESFRISNTAEAKAAHLKTLMMCTSYADVIFLSGCLDEQVSADLSLTAEAEDEENIEVGVGALSLALLSYLRLADENKEKPTYKDILVRVHEMMDDMGLNQRPQLSSSHPIDLDLQFVI